MKNEIIKKYKKHPDWLIEAVHGNFYSREIPLREMLEDSFYYPASGCDYLPIQFLAGKIFSFIYVDYMAQYTRELQYFQDHMDPSILFDRRYDMEVLFSREVKAEEFMIEEWIPQQDYPDRRPSGRRGHEHFESKRAVWAIMEVRVNKDYEPDSELSEDLYSPHYYYGKALVSLLYIFDEGVKMYDALYYQNSTHPAILALIQAFGFSSNWCNFRNEKDVLGEKVLDNPFGVPEYLMYGGWGMHTKKDPGHYGDPAWSSYSEYVDAAMGIDNDGTRRYEGIWKKTLNLRGRK